jgi:hypothetical protein
MPVGTTKTEYTEQRNRIYRGPWFMRGCCAVEIKTNQGTGVVFVTA